MINRANNFPENDEDLSFINTNFNLCPSVNIKTSSGYLKHIKNITFVPRSGTHNNFISNEEIIIYVISGELTYDDSTGEQKLLKRGSTLYVYGDSGITYNIFNNGIDYLDILVLSVDTSHYTKKNSNISVPITIVTAEKDSENQWNYKVSPKNGLASIKSFSDINIYTLELSAMKSIDFEIKKERTGFLIQCYGESFMTALTSNKNYKLQGADGLKISSEEFNIKSEIDSNFVLIEAPQY